ncbi:MAG: hypothetical protein ACPHJD_01470 [Poseidonia sp.]|jgi:hypothetical protein
MEQGRFPIAAVRLGSSGDLSPIDAFIRQRPSNRWVMLGQHSVQSLDQVWTAWIQATRNELRSAMVARSVDAEFLRYLAGTHHISEAFVRAGWTDTQQHAWVASIPVAEGVANDLGHLQPSATETERFEADLAALVNELGWTVEEIPMTLSIEGMSTLGIDVEGWPDERLQEALIAHILMADDQSSSHR